MFSFYHNKKKKVLDKESILLLFFKDPYHHWICENKRILKLFTSFFLEIEEKVLDELLIEKQVCFLPLFDSLSCLVLPPPGRPLIFIFPLLYKRLLSGDSQGAMAVLAHELGHLWYGHDEGVVSSQKAQIEADSFAFQLGLGADLLKILWEYEKHPFVLERIHLLERSLNTL